MHFVAFLFPYFPISLLVYHTEANGFSHSTVWSAPPDTEKISQQQLTLVIRLLRVEFYCL